MDQNFKFYSLGGSGEVGMNLLVFQFGSEIIPVDAGVVFADSNDFGLEAVHPNMEYFGKENFPKTWLITHGHEDHIGAAMEIFAAAKRLGAPVPRVLAPSLVIGLVKSKVLDDQRYSFDRNEALSALTEIKTGDDIEIADGLFVRFIENRHSIVQSCSLAFRWKGAGASELRVLHTSDFKLDHRRYQDGVKNLEIFDAFQGQPPDVLFIDSTNSERDGHTVSELEILEPLERLIQQAGDGRVFVSMFSSNLLRIAHTLLIAKRLGRSVALAGRSMQQTVQIARGLGIFDKYTPDISGVELVEPSRLGQFPPNRQLVICSGSQGEQRSVLMRLAQGVHPEFQIQEGDAVILSSKVIPGNEKSISRMMNGLLRNGAKVYLGEYAKIVAQGPIHASGHARRTEIAEVLRFLRPKHIVPVHGELRQLMSCAELARTEGRSWGLQDRDVSIMENGTRLVFEEGRNGWELSGRESLGDLPRILRFENFVAESKDPFLKVRKRAALGGAISVVIQSDGGTRVQAQGVLPENDQVRQEELLSYLEDWCHERYRGRLAKDWPRGALQRADLERELGDELERMMRKIYGTKSLAFVHLAGF